jgi:hypothetical protein
VLLAELARVEDALRPLDAQRNELLAKLHELDPQKYPSTSSGQAVVTAAEAETVPPLAVAPAKKKTGRGPSTGPSRASGGSSGRD